MISIVDVKDLQYVLRPTVYRRLGASAEGSEGSRGLLGEAVADRAVSAQAAEVDQAAAPSKR